MRPALRLVRRIWRYNNSFYLCFSSLQFLILNVALCLLELAWKCRAVRITSTSCCCLLLSISACPCLPLHIQRAIQEGAFCPHLVIHGKHLLCLLRLLSAYIVCSVPVAPSRFGNYQLTSCGIKSPSRLRVLLLLSSILQPSSY